MLYLALCNMPNGSAAKGRAEMTAAGRIRAHPGSAEGVTPADASGRRIQYAALCYRAQRGKVQVLMITSRDTGRWVIPKGWPMAGISPAECAAQEAWEEAGVKGQAAPHSEGRFYYDKVLGPRTAVPCTVEVYPLRVERLAGEFPEKGQRRRKWFSLQKAAQKVAEPELAQILAAFVPPGAGG